MRRTSANYKKFDAIFFCGCSGGRKARRPAWAQKCSSEHGNEHDKRQRQEDKGPNVAIGRTREQSAESRARCRVGRLQLFLSLRDLMSLRTNTRTGGLPSNPRSRTNQAQTQAPARDDYYSDAGSRSYDRAGQRDYGSGQSAQRNDRGGGYDDYDRGYASSNAAYNGAGNGGGGGGGRQDYASSTTTTSSSASSSLLDRMKQRSNVSSARASAEDDHNQPQSKSNSLRAGGRSLRAPPQQQQRDPEPDQYYGPLSRLCFLIVPAVADLVIVQMTVQSRVVRARRCGDAWSLLLGPSK